MEAKYRRKYTPFILSSKHKHNLMLSNFRTWLYILYVINHYSPLHQEKIIHIKVHIHIIVAVLNSFCLIFQMIMRKLTYL